MRIHEKLPLDQVESGTVLAEPVIDEMGRVLVPGGAELTESILRSLARREIAELTVSREVEEDAAEREAYRLKQATELDRVFRKAGEGAETRALYQAILDYRMENRS
jgi:hypothetical protein